MSNPWLPRDPAYSSLQPKQSSLQILTAETTHWFANETGLSDGVFLRLETTALPPLGHYKYSGEDRYFIKVLKTDQMRHQMLADSISAFVYESGGAALRPYRWIETKDGYSIGLYPFIDGRFANHTSDDSRILGAGLAQLHKILKSYPNKYLVKRSSQERMQMLSRRYNAIINGQLPDRPEAESIYQLFKKNEYDPFKIKGDLQIIHGDLNLANLLFDSQSPKVTFIDFENAAVSWLPCHHDLSMVMQRSCLVSNKTYGEKIRFTAELINAYTSNGGLSYDSDTLISSMKWLSVRNICLLAEKESSGICVTSQEWEKFLHLHRLADQSVKLVQDAVRGAYSQD